MNIGHTIAFFQDFDTIEFLYDCENRCWYIGASCTEFSFKGRENFATHNGFIEVGATFPLWGKLKGYAQFSSGYGESLIDYNKHTTKVGLGFAFYRSLF